MKKLAVFIPVLIAVAITSCVYVKDGGGSEQVKRTYTVVIETNREPFCFTDESGNVSGFEYELFNTVFGHKQINVEYLYSDDAVSDFNSGTGDMLISGVKMTDENKKMYDFTIPYFQSGIIAATGADNNSINSLADLGLTSEKNKAAVVNGSNAFEFATLYSTKYKFGLVYVDSLSELFAKLSDKTVQAVFCEAVSVDYENRKNTQYKTISESVDLRSYGGAVRKGENEELIKTVDDGLGEVMNNGDYNKILKAYGLLNQE